MSGRDGRCMTVSPAGKNRNWWQKPCASAVRMYTARRPALLRAGPLAVVVTPPSGIPVDLAHLRHVRCAMRRKP